MSAWRCTNSAYASSSPRLAQKIAEGVGDSFIRRNHAQKIEALRKFGCVEGGTVRLEVRSAQNDLDGLQQPAGSPGQVRGACDDRDQTPHR